MAVPPGSRLGPYEVISALGAGGMGEVYRARDTKLGRDVALKFLPEAFAADPDRLMRFEREARTLAALNHPSIAQVYGIEDSGPARALVMELVEGEDLSARIARGPLQADEAVAIARQMAEALLAAHEAGIIHRDLKPGNVKVKEDGTVKVLDFGLAKALEPGTSAAEGVAGASPDHSPTITSPALTRAGIILGTAAYMSPEQARGRAVDKRADVWAFGAVLYEMLTGARAFDGEDLSDTLALVLRGEPDWSRLPPSLPAALTMLVRRCLDRDIRRRVGDMSAVRFVLDELSGLSSAQGPSGSSASPAHAGAGANGVERRSSPLRMALVLGIVAIAAAALGLGAARALTGTPPAPVPVRFELPLPQASVLALARRIVALSPDGGEVAFVNDTQLFVRRFSEFEATPVRGVESGAGLSLPAYSPDGEWIAVHSGAEQAVVRVRRSGGAPIRVCDVPPPRTLSWDATGLLVGAGIGGGGILRCSPDGGPPETLVNAGDGDVLFAPQLLPGGRTVMYSRARTDGPLRPSVVARSLEGGEPRTVVPEGGDARYLDSGHLLYHHGGILFAVRFNPETLQTEGQPVPLLEGIMQDPTGGMQMTLSPTGTLVYMPGPVGVSQTARELAIGDREGGFSRLPLPAGPYVHVRVNPSATEVALGSDNGTDAIIWIYALDGKAAARRLTIEGRNRFPIWSPDGRWITFQSDRAGSPGIYRQRADGTGGAERLTTSGAGESHVPESWSPDGRHLAFSVRAEAAQGPTYALHILSAPDGTFAPYGRVTSREPIGAVFSPDGRWLAYTSTATEDITTVNRGVFVQPFPATGAVFQAPRQLVDFHPVWSADGRELIFVASTNARLMASVRVTVDGGMRFGGPTRFPASVMGDRLSGSPRSFDLLPDGRLVGVVTRYESGSTIYSDLRVVLNWLDETRPRLP